jgi:hypothetical protein
VVMLRNESMNIIKDGECFRGTYHMEFIERCDLLVQTSWDYNSYHAKDVTWQYMQRYGISNLIFQKLS